MFMGSNARIPQPLFQAFLQAACEYAEDAKTDVPDQVTVQVGQEE